jgi:putative membrane protein
LGTFLSNERFVAGDSTPPCDNLHQSLPEVVMAFYRRRKSPVAGILLGSLSGLVGTILMTRFQVLWKKATEEIQPPKRSEGKEKQSEEDSTVKVARTITEATGHTLPQAQKEKAGNWVHYGFGALMGGMYGLARETIPQSLLRRLHPAFVGAGYGSAVFVGAHEIAVPALDLGSNPLAEPVPDQVSHYLAHLVYGVGTSLTYSALRRIG